ncbi:hypothetical protein [Blastococcus tunisiensis]|uniref:Uncharacterized protein n=1 Tax=Blastococcus tunisiensis TaxID=1798228 RepID=A0A1I1XMB6_9ACTN|nr:hypothetical protein [Blastococcus sp. DSM 46838]SFE08477.1 hypothetical protein SAMN05216574_102121 [Blastococcus sp. DSM 46838]
MTNLVLLCDRDHGLVHEHDLVMSRTGGRLVVTAPDGRRVWGAADAAFVGGLGDVGDPAPADRPHFAGVHPIDTGAGRRPDAPPTAPANPLSSEPSRSHGRRRAATRRSARGPGSRPRPATPDPAAGRPAALGHSTPSGLRRRYRSQPGSIRCSRRTDLTASARAAAISTTLFPDGEPDLPDAMRANGERMDVRYVVGVLMGNRDLARRLAAEAAGVPAGTP